MNRISKGNYKIYHGKFETVVFIVDKKFTKSCYLWAQIVEKKGGGSFTTFSGSQGLTKIDCKDVPKRKNK